MTQANLPRSSLVLVAMITVIWGFNWPIMKTVLGEVPPFTFRALCMAAGAIGLFAIAKFNALPLRVPAGQWQRLIASALFNITGWNLLIAFGLKYVAAGRGVILAYTMPMWTVMLSMIFLHEQVTGRRALGLMFGMIAMFILVSVEFAQLRAAPLGALLVVGAALSWSIGTVIMKRYPVDLPTTSMTGWMMVLGGIPIWIATPFFENITVRKITLWPALGVVYNMTLAVVFCYWAWNKLVSRGSASVTALSTLLIPVLGVFSSMLLLGEQPRWQEFSALALVMVSLMLVLLPRRRRS
ncbi:MAG: DMT family transporter [Pseudomonadota bacterium]|nr:DMT family transporter [Pseudomonadota bacterium]